MKKITAIVATEVGFIRILAALQEKYCIYSLYAEKQERVISLICKNDDVSDIIIYLNKEMKISEIETQDVEEINLNEEILYEFLKKYLEHTNISIDYALSLFTEQISKALIMNKDIRVVELYIKQFTDMMKESMTKTHMKDIRKGDILSLKFNSELSKKLGDETKKVIVIKVSKDDIKVLPIVLEDVVKDEERWTSIHNDEIKFLPNEKIKSLGYIDFRDLKSIPFYQIERKIGEVPKELVNKLCEAAAENLIGE